MFIPESITILVMLYLAKDLRHLSFLSFHVLNLLVALSV